MKKKISLICPDKLSKADLLRALLLAILAACFWCYLTGRTTVQAWNVPLEYGLKGDDGDVVGNFAHMVGAENGDFHPFAPMRISRLAAPYYSLLSDVPIPEKWIYCSIGWTARLTGLFAAANFSILLAQVLGCLCFYFAARLLKCQWWWAMAGGVAFGFAQFALARSIHHINVTHYWYIPLCLVMVDWMTRGELGALRGRRYLGCVGLSFLIGMWNPYYTGMFLQLLLLGALYQAFRQGWTAWLQAGGIIVASALGFFLMNLDTFLSRLIYGANPGAVVREFKWLEFSALKFTDLFIPPPDHRFFGALGDYYYNHLVSIPHFPEVPPSCYLGLLGIGAMGWLLVLCVRRLAAQPAGNVPLEAWQILWITAYSVTGGLNSFAGILGFTLFRSTTRYSIFILPILLLFAIRRLSRMRIEREVGIVLSAGAILLALFDQTPPVETPAQIEKVAKEVRSDQHFTEKMEAMLPKGAMVFQLPVMDYPEAPAPGMPSYSHMRPYLYSRDLRFSFGGIRGRPWLEWQKNIMRDASLKTLIERLERYGFAALYINRNGMLGPNGTNITDDLLKGCAELGYKDVLISDTGELICVRLTPSPHPILPAGAVR